MTGLPADLLLPLFAALGWLIRVPPLSREEGHEEITRRAWEGLGLTTEQQAALIRGVRAPDISLVGILTSALPSAQRRHALRAWFGTTTADAVRDTRDFIASAHRRAMAMPDGPRRWAAFGEVLHCLQDSYSPAHTDRAGGRIVRMKHWGPLDGLRRGRPDHDEHAFPSDGRDSVWTNGVLTQPALDAVEASHRYLDLTIREVDPAGRGQARDQITSLLDDILWA